MLEELKEQVFRANAVLVKYGIIGRTRGTVSGIDRERGLIVVTPCDADYEGMTSEDMVVVDLIDGKVAEGKNRPSSDTPAHLFLYNAFPEIGGIARTCSVNAVSWAQAGKVIPAYGAIHAETFCGEIPCTRALTEEEMTGKAYETNIGKVIEETFKDKDFNAVPAVLVKAHGSFAWGATPEKAAENAMTLEFVAEAALKTLRIEPQTEALPKCFTDKFSAVGRGKNRGGRKK